MISSRKPIYTYSRTDGISHKLGEYENQDATPPIQYPTPEWIYQLAKIDNADRVLMAKTLHMPNELTIQTYPEKEVVLTYREGSEHEGEYTWKYIGEQHSYMVKHGPTTVTYFLWQQFDVWYATYILQYDFKFGRA